MTAVTLAAKTSAASSLPHDVHPPRFRRDRSRQPAGDVPPDDPVTPADRTSRTPLAIRPIRGKLVAEGKHASEFLRATRSHRSQAESLRLRGCTKGFPQRHRDAEGRRFFERHSPSPSASCVSVSLGEAFVLAREFTSVESAARVSVCVEMMGRPWGREGVRSRGLRPRGGHFFTGRCVH